MPRVVTAAEKQLETRVYSRLREFGWTDERIAHYLQSLKEQTGWDDETVLMDTEHACDEGPESLEPWRKDAYLETRFCTKLQTDEDRELEARVYEQLRALGWRDEFIDTWLKAMQIRNRYSSTGEMDHRGALEQAEMYLSWWTPEFLLREARFDMRVAENCELADAWPKAVRVMRATPRHERPKLRGLDPRIVVKLHRPLRLGRSRVLGRTPRSRRLRTARSSRAGPARSSDDPPRPLASWHRGRA